MNNKDSRTHNHAGSVHQLVIHPYTAKQPLLQHLHDIPPLYGQTLAESQQKNAAWDLRHETCPHGAVKVWWRDLQSCWECSSTCYTPIQYQRTTIAAPTWWHTSTWWPNVGWELAESQDIVSLDELKISFSSSLSLYTLLHYLHAGNYSIHTTAQYHWLTFTSWSLY